MKAPRTRPSLLAATVALLVLPQIASAAYYVPPSNSAATQYTEAFPTAGGDKDAENGGTTQHHSPAKVLGSRNAQRLESQGPEGNAVAAIAAETAPVESVTTTPATQSPKSEASPGPSKPQAKSKSHHPKKPSYASPPPAHEPQSLSSAEPSGSSGLGEVLAQATGSSSSGGLGLLLPLALLGALAWAIAYLSSQRRKKPAA
jgi:hypothetical protein